MDQWFLNSHGHMLECYIGISILSTCNCKREQHSEMQTLIHGHCIQSHLPQSKLLLGTRGDVQLPTHASFSKKLQQPLSKRLKHLIRPTLQFELQAYRNGWVLHVHGIGRGREKSGVTHIYCIHFIHSEVVEGEESQKSW